MLKKKDGSKKGKQDGSEPVRAECHKSLKLASLVLPTCPNQHDPLPLVFCLLIDVGVYEKNYGDKALADTGAVRWALEV